MVGKAAAVIALKPALSQDDFMQHQARRLVGVLLPPHAFLHLSRYMAHLQQPLILWVAVTVGVNHQVRFGTLGEEFFSRHLCQHLPVKRVIISSM